VTVFSVWAPTPKHVELAINGQLFPMSRQRGDWWAADGPSLAAPGDYGFVLDGEGPFPDPRSGHQPYGAEGLSRLVSHPNFD